MENKKSVFNIAVAVVAAVVIIAFAIFRNSQVTKQNKILNYPSATEFNYK